MPVFNYQAAIRDGRTPEQIQAYLAKRKKQGVNLTLAGQSQ